VLAGGRQVRPDVIDAPWFVKEFPELADMKPPISGTENLRRLVKAYASKGVDHIKVLATERAGLVNADPRKRTFTDEELIAIVDEARKAGLKVAAHAHGDEGGYAAVKAGVRSIEHGTWLSDRTLRLMRAQGTWLVSNIFGDSDRPMGSIFSTDPIIVERGRTMWPQASKVTRRAYQMGVHLVGATDIGYEKVFDSGRWTIADNALGFAVAGIPKMEAIKAITSHAAQLLEIDKRTGAIRKGLEADIVVVGDNPLSSIKALKDIRMIVNDGKVVFNVLTTTVPSAQEVKQVAANGSSFAYVEAGSGQPVVLIHGSVSDYREWSKQIEALAQHYHVIAFSRRYHWPNAAPTANADASLEVQVEDLAAIIKALNICPAHLVGHSYGGAVALQLALRHPELVRNLVLVEPAVAGVLTDGPEDEAARKEGQASRAEMNAVIASGDAERIMRTYATHVAPGVYEKAVQELRQMLLDNAPAFQLDYNSRRPAFTCEIAKQIAAPALFLAGERSPLGLQRIAEKAAGCLKSAKFIRIPDATHWIPHDQPWEFNEALLAFLANYETTR
jgi:pimeloyl-ACP methyl ester carboxylesterase